jgi:hypothetical protein
MMNPRELMSKKTVDDALKNEESGKTMKDMMAGVPECARSMMVDWFLGEQSRSYGERES